MPWSRLVKAVAKRHALRMTKRQLRHQLFSARRTIRLLRRCLRVCVRAHDREQDTHRRAMQDAASTLDAMEGQLAEAWRQVAAARQAPLWAGA